MPWQGQDDMEVSHKHIFMEHFVITRTPVAKPVVTFSSAWEWHLLISTADTKLGQHNSIPTAAQEQLCEWWFAHSRNDVQQSRDLRQL